MSSSSGAVFNRPLTRILREKGRDERIKCTSTLVASYNSEENAKSRRALRKWLEAHVDEFSLVFPRFVTRKTIAEFVNLAEIKNREPADAELVRRVYTVVRQIVVGEKEGVSIYFVLALEYILSIVDKEILQEDSRTLIALADRLLEMTDPKKMPLTRDTFEYHASCLHAFERVLMVLHDLEKDRPNNDIVKYFEDKTKRHLDMIISCQCYYPFAYHALLIKEHLNALLKRDIKSLLINARRRAFYAFCGELFIFQGVRELAVMKLDFDTMESGIGKFREAFQDIGWDMMPNIQEIVLTASETVESDDFGVFQQCFDKYKRVSWLEGLKWSKQRAIRYALVSHLCLFCMKEHSRWIRTEALDLLVKLVCENEGKQWRDDWHILEAMIEALVAIGKNSQEYQQTIITTLKMISSSHNSKHKKAIDGLLQGMKLNEIIISGFTPQEDTFTRSLFNYTRQRISSQGKASIYNQNVQTLKNYYRSDSFAKVSLFADENDQCHIKTFEFNLEEYEEVVVSRELEGHSSQGNYNQRENNHQRTTLVKKHIGLKDLFGKRIIPSRKLQENAQRILVIGNSGTGKTCLMKRICHDWSIGAQGQEFTHVYLLPIRSLSDTCIGHCSDLPSIILQLVYNVNGMQGSNKAVYEEVKGNLSEATTLVILDGYDEAGNLAKNLVSSSLSLGCCLLISSRPHIVQEIRLRADIELECLEFSEKQLESFVHGELGHNDGDDLLEFFSKNLFIKDTCRIAINAQIIVRLWKSSYKEKLVKSSCANLSWFYSMVSKYIWTRFTDKEDRLDMNKTFDSLELVAFESFKEGMVEIPQELVMDHAPDAQKMFRDSGFLIFLAKGSVFQFTHLTFHEYFAGRCLAKMLKSTNGEEKKKAERFISQHKYIETSRVMLSFMTQCYCESEDMERSLEALKDLMEVLNKDPLPTISLQHLFLRMRTLDAFLPCGLDKSEVVQTNDVVIQVVNDAMDALKRWFGYELGEEKGEDVLCHDSDLRTPIIDELVRMPNLFNRFPNLLKPILLNESGKERFADNHRRDFARVGRLNPHHALQCILPMLDDATDEEQASMIELCAFIGPMCGEPTMDHLKRLCNSQTPKTREMATRPLVVFIDLFPEREDVRQLVVDASKDPNVDVRRMLMRSIEVRTFTSETEAGTFVWDLLIEAIKNDNRYVRANALGSCRQHYQTFAKSIDEVVELVREFAFSPTFVDRESASYAIRNLTQKAQKKSEELLVLVESLCRNPNKDLHIRAVHSFKNIVKSSCLRREDLFNVAFDLFKDGYPNVQLELLPFLFSFDKKENRGIDKINEWIAYCQDLDEEVEEKAISCNAANALLLRYTIEEIHDRFDDQDKEVQLEIVGQLDMKEMESSKGTDAIAEMASHCLQYDQKYEPSQSLLKELSETELFPNIVLEQLAAIDDWEMKACVQQQPLSHLLKYYWSKEDPNMILFIAQKLLFSPVIFERKGEKEMVVTFREKGANVKQTAPVGVVQDLISRCKDILKGWYGLDFFQD